MFHGSKRVNFLALVTRKAPEEITPLYSPHGRSVVSPGSTDDLFTIFRLVRDTMELALRNDERARLEFQEPH